MILESWYLDIASISLTRLHLLNSNVQFQHPMQLSKVLHKQLCLPELFQQAFHLFQGAPMHFVGWTPPPMLESNWCLTRTQEAKCTNKGRVTCFICCTWAWSSSHSNSAFLFTLSRAFFSFHFCLACGLLKIWTFIVWWFCCLGPPTWVEGRPNLPTSCKAHVSCPNVDKVAI